MTIPLYILASLSVIGLADASYITYEELAGKVPPCLPLPMFNCAGVLQSAWAHFGPIPLSVLGMGFYAIVLLLTIALITLKHPPKYVRTALFGFGAFGFLFSLYLFYIQAIILQAFCTFCLISAFTCTLIFITSSIYFLKTKTNAK